MLPGDLLLYTIALPFIAGLMLVCLGDMLKPVIRSLSLIVAILCMAACAYIFIHKPVVSRHPASGIFLADNLSAPIGMAISFFASLVTLYSFGSADKKLGRYFGYIMLTLSAALAAVYADNAIVLLTAWGFMAATLYLIVLLGGSKKAVWSAKKAFIIIGATDSLLIFGLGLLWLMTGTFSISLMKLPAFNMTAYVSYFCILAAAFAKAGAMPLHSWVPDVAENSPAAVSAYLPASLDKLLGIYLIARVSLQVFTMNGATNFILLAAGSLTIICAVAMALVQHDFKRLLGYHAVSQVGYMIVGIGTGNPIGIAGGLFHMFNHTIYKSCLFLTSGAVEKRAQTTDLGSLGGMGKYMPYTFGAFIIAALAISGIPPLNGFVSKWMIYQGIIELGSSNPGNYFWIVWLVAAMFGSVLTLASFTKLFHSVFLGRTADGLPKISEVEPVMVIPMVILAVTAVVFGLWAFTIPISLFVLPAVGKVIVYSGIWSAGMATNLILAGILLGLVMYIFSGRKKIRRSGSFIGGEDEKQLVRVTGVEFYNTIKEIKGAGFLYSRQERGVFDVYDQGSRLLSLFSKLLRRLHNGILPTYLAWCLIGMIAIFIIYLLR